MTRTSPQKHTHHASHVPKRGRARRRSALGLVLVLGMLFWARLLIIADLPRMAIATDPEKETDAKTDVNIDAETDAKTNPKSDAAAESEDSARSY